MPELTPLEFADLMVTANALHHALPTERERILTRIRRRISRQYARDLFDALSKEEVSQEHAAAIALVRTSAGVATK